MKNELLLQQAIELLSQVNGDELETVSIQNTKFDDGSIGLSVELTYPAEKATRTSYESVAEVQEAFRAEGSD